MIVAPDVAEAFGVLLGDGCLSRTLQGGSWASQVAFTANPSEFRYYQDFIQPTIESVFGVRGHLYLRDDNTTRYHIASAELVLKLHRLGFPIGKKRDASIPKRPDCPFHQGPLPCGGFNLQTLLQEIQGARKGILEPPQYSDSNEAPDSHATGPRRNQQTWDRHKQAHSESWGVHAQNYKTRDGEEILRHNQTKVQANAPSSKSLMRELGPRSCGPVAQSIEHEKPG